MAIETADIETLYDTLEDKAKTTLENLFDAYTLTAEGKASVIAQTITMILQLSVQTVMDKPIKDAQASLIAQQEATEVEKEALTKRQEESYDDNLRIKEAEMLANIAGMMGAGGATFSTADNGATGFLSTMYSKIDAITQ